DCASRPRADRRHRVRDTRGSRSTPNPADKRPRSTTVTTASPYCSRRPRRDQGKRNSATIARHAATRSGMDIIYLQHLTGDTVIGVWDWERRIRQTLIMDLELGVDTARAGASDDLTATVDYKAVTDRVTSFTAASGFKLIEALAENIARIVLSEFPVQWIKVR